MYKTKKNKGKRRYVHFVLHTQSAQPSLTLEILPLKDFRGPVSWAKIVHFWKPWKHAFWPLPECQRPFSMRSRHVLFGIMVWNAGVGPWWAATAEIFKCHLLSTFAVDSFQGHNKPNLTRSKGE
jgi:hypothetical protein